MRTFGLFVVAALVFACRLSADSSPPAVPSASVSPTSADVTAASQIVTITFRATDGGSGVEYGNTYLYDAEDHMVALTFFGSSERISGDSMDGTYRVTMAVPRFARPGLWRVDAFVRDYAGNQVTFDPHQTPFPDPAAMKFTVMNDGPVDIETPALVSSSVTPGEVNVTAADAALDFTVEITDNLSGFDFGFLTLKSADGSATLSHYFSPDNLGSGTPLNGIYQFTMTIPRGSPAGAWTYEFSLKDEVGNNINTPAAGNINVVSEPPPPLSPGFLAQAVDAVQLPWKSTGGGWLMDTATTFDGSDAAASRTVLDGETASLETTVTGPGELSFWWRVSSETDSDFLTLSVDGVEAIPSISGDGNWESVAIQLSAGEHAIAWTYSKDGAGSAHQDRGYLDRVRFRTEGEVAELPTLQNLEISPRVIDLADGPREVQFTVEVTDDFNGVAQGRLELYDPSGTQRVSTTFDNPPDEGDFLDGKWLVTMEIPSDAPSGLWRAEVELTEATSGATRRYGPGSEAFPGQKTEVFFVVNLDASDAVAPQVQSIEVTPNPVDITAGEKSVTVTVRVTDAMNGFYYGEILVYNPDENWIGGYYLDSSNRIAGDIHNGIYQVEVGIPAFAKPGRWTLGARLTDNQNQTAGYPDDFGFPPDVTSSFRVINAGVVDLNQPRVTSIDISPGTVDTSSGPATVQVTVSIEDNPAGLQSGYLYLYNPAEEFQEDYFIDLSHYRIAGNAFAGTYRVPLALPQGSVEGQWHIRVFLRDTAGNAIFYGKNAEAYPEVGDGVFNVGGTVPSVFAAYIAGFSLAGNDALTTADPDRDGLNNATEALLGTHPSDPASAASGRMAASRDATHFYLNFTIAPALTATMSGNSLELRNGSSGAPLRLTGQTQTNLVGPWTAVAPQHLGGRNYRISIPLSAGPRNFLRLSLEDP